MHRLSSLAAAAAVVLAACGSQAPAQAPASTSSATASRPASSAGASAATKPSASSTSKVVVAYSQASSGFAPIYSAADAGIFQKNGLDVDVKRVNGAAQVPALVANELQIAGVGGTEVTNVDLAGGSLVMLATVDDYPTFSLYANKKYKTVADLAGESVGITTAGSSTDASAQLFLKHFNMLDKVKIQPSGSTVAGILAAMASSNLAAGILSPPVTAQADKQGFVELVNGYKLGEPLNTAGYTVTKSYLKGNPEIIRKFLKAYTDGWNYVADPANKAAVIKSLMKYTETDEATAVIGYDATLAVWQAKKVPTVDPQGIANILALSKDPKAKDAKPSDFLDNSYLEAAVK